MSDLSIYKKIYIIGIAGAGMSGIASILQEEGFAVSGSDMKQTEYMKYLESLGIYMYPSDDLSVIKTVDCVLASSAVPKTNPLIVEANNHNIPVITRHSVFTYWSRKRPVIACSGCHGKTTTTSMLGHMYPEYGRLVGVQHKNSAYSGLSGTPFILEADEYAKTFLSIYPKIALVTNIERDHVDIYPTEKEYFDTFRQFLTQTIDNNGCLVMCGDDIHSYTISTEYKDTNACITYGFNMKNDVVISRRENGSFSLVMNPQSRYYSLLSEVIVSQCNSLSLSVIGSHNMLNAVGCIIVSILHELGIESVKGDITKLIYDERLFKGNVTRIESFVNVSRRQEYMGRIGDENALWYDDYGHTPTEIYETVKAFTQHFKEKKIVVCFQPHSLERFNGFIDQFLTSFKFADTVFVTDIFVTRGEEYKGGRGTKEQSFVDDLISAGTHAEYIPLNAIEDIKTKVDANTVLVSLNAGTLRGCIQRIQ